MICTLVTWKPNCAEIVEKATTAAAIGEHVIEGVYHVAGTDEHRKEERSEWRKESDTVWMLAKQPFRYLYHPVHASGGLQHARTGHGGDDDVDNIGGRVAWLEVKTKDQYSQAYTGDGTKCQRAVARAYPKSEQDSNHSI